MADAQTRHKRGFWVIALLVMLLSLITLLIVFKSCGGTSRPLQPQVVESLIVIPQRVRIRTEPATNAPVVASAASGETVTLIEDHGTWVRVRTNDGLAGWVERASLERAVERQRRLKRYENIRKLPKLEGTVTRNTPLFSGPGIFYTPIGELDAGEKITVYTRDHDFYGIEYRSTIAYAAIDSVEVTAAGSQRLEVASTPTTATDTAAEPLPEAEPVPEEEPEPEPPQIADASPRVDHSGVYPTVPPGGTQPEEIDRVVPQYPPAARRAGVSGAVVVRGIVRRDGTIDDVEVVKDLPYGLGDSARRAVRQWRFRPATYRGEPIDVYYTVTVNFRLR